MEKIFHIPEYKIYCEHISSSNWESKWSVLMIPWWAHSGACYKNTPDWRKWWAYLLSEQGYDIFLMDWPWTWRSWFIVPEKLNSQFIVDGISVLIKKHIKTDILLFTHSMSGPFGRKLMETCWNQIKKIIAIAPWQMWNIQPEPIIINRTDEYVEASLVKAVSYKISIKEDYVCDPERAKKKLIWESKHFPMEFFDEYFSWLYNIPRFVLKERLNVDGTQLKIESFDWCKNIEVLVITWWADTDHPYNLDKKIVDFLNNNGIKTNFIYLPEHWLEDNGHMLMLEKNNKEILDLIIKNF